MSLFEQTNSAAAVVVQPFDGGRGTTAPAVARGTLDDPGSAAAADF